jgi:hypothetical protein
MRKGIITLGVGKNPGKLAKKFEMQYFWISLTNWGLPLAKLFSPDSQSIMAKRNSNNSRSGLAGLR